MNEKKYDIEERLIDFAVAIVLFVEGLPNTKSIETASKRK